MLSATTRALMPWPPQGLGDARFRARAFADEAGDLDIDFDGTSRVAVVTDLLARCVRDTNDGPVSAAVLQQWTVAERLQGLLAIASASVGPVSRAVATCTHSGCGGQVELELGNAGFAQMSVTVVDWTTPSDATVRLRLPTGDDLAAWQDQAPSVAHEEAWWVRRLIVSVDGEPPSSEWTTPSTWLVPIAETLEDADPLTALVLDVDCPFCGRVIAVDVDLEYLLIERLGACQRALTDEIHRLASAYHWNERDIADLPVWRRRQYLDRLQADLV
jgi:hypothetical protein